MTTDGDAFFRVPRWGEEDGPEMEELLRVSAELDAAAAARRGLSPAVWGAFHTGTIRGIDGTTPGDLVLRIEDRDLAGQLQGAGPMFFVRLAGCRQFRLRTSRTEFTDDLAAIASRGLRILSIGQWEPPVVECIEGLLAIDCEAMSVTLQDGTPVSEEDLVAARNRWWAPLRRAH